MEARAKLRDWRLKKDLSQVAFAELLGVTRNFVGFLERGEQKPGLTVANKIKKLTGIKQEAWDKPASGT